MRKHTAHSAACTYITHCAAKRQHSPTSPIVHQCTLSTKPQLNHSAVLSSLSAYPKVCTRPCMILQHQHLTPQAAFSRNINISHPRQPSTAHTLPTSPTRVIGARTHASTVLINVKRPLAGRHSSAKPHSSQAPCTLLQGDLAQTQVAAGSKA
jgi:hypothetical protein